ncbi:MAG: phosphate ABC transporter substrate-binding protein PstS [Bacteroidota bacterium]|nr:phosphate ABC transporter substrate-binding protein PstS [Bacteroidota bacterium]
MKKLATLLISAVILLTACNNSDNKSENKENEKVTLTAAGATFPMPFYNMVFKQYTKSTEMLLTYGGIGSGGGIRSLKDKIVDFGATDAFLSDEQMKDLPAEIVHIPTCLGAVVLAYNLEGIESIKLTNELIEGIFMGEITRWNDEKIAENNPTIDLPDTKITVVHRSDGSGTTFIFSDFMSKISKKWNENVGRGKSLKWPTGLGAKGNPGVAGTISQTTGAIGYIGSEYAFAQKIPVALLQNKAGNYIEASIESISNAAKGEIPADTRVMITNSEDAGAYPISGFTWIILYKDQNYDGRSKLRAMETVKFLNWLLSEDAQSKTKKVHYSPLPESTVKKAKDILNSVNYDGEKLLK